MATMNISLTDPLKQFVDEEVREGGYSSTSDYVRDLIRRDQERADKIAAMQRLVDEAEAGGAGSLTVEQIFDEAIARSKAG